MVVTVEILWTSILARRARWDKSPDWSDVELRLARPIRVEPKRTDVLFVNLEISMTRGFDHSQRFMANSHEITGNNGSEKLTGFRRFQTDFSSSLLLLCCNQQQKMKWTSILRKSSRHCLLCRPLRILCIEKTFQSRAKSDNAIVAWLVLDSVHFWACKLSCCYWQNTNLLRM